MLYTFHIMSKIENNALGAVGEHQALSRLLLFGYQAPPPNLSIENAANTDILCRNADGRFAAIQVKTTRKDSFLIGISHSKFYDQDGNVDMAKGRKFLETKIVGPWVMVHVGGSEECPTFEFFVLSRAQIIELIYSNEEWYLNGHKRTKPLKGSGMIAISTSWLEGKGIRANNRHIEWVNPLAATKFNEAWDNLWID